MDFYILTQMVSSAHHTSREKSLVFIIHVSDKQEVRISTEVHYCTFQVPITF